MHKVIEFLKEVRQEFGNITWPKRDALIQLTVVVISISIIISLLLGAFDYLFTNSINALGDLKNQTKVNNPVAIPTIGIPATPSASPLVPITTFSPVKPIITPKK